VTIVVYISSQFPPDPSQHNVQQVQIIDGSRQSAVISLNLNETKQERKRANKSACVLVKSVKVNEYKG
jgi:hypothetical protein